VAFWSDYSVSTEGKGFEPKRKFTFLLSIVGKDLSLENYLIKKVKRPGFEISESEHKFLNHTFYYPGKVKWKEVSFTVVDVINPNTAQKFLTLLSKCGYNGPNGPVTIPGGLATSANTTAQTVGKLRSVEALGIPRI